MNSAVELEGRPRPLSACLWNLFSWLRRDDRSDSNDSLSSAGSDRTVASFAFLKPALYQSATPPFVLPPPGPPTDSYKKRVHDRNLRRQYDRDITLHRKYGLFKSGETPYNYDAFSLPPARRVNSDSCDRRDRERRASSECFQRRLPHVPGKRRAPLPPVFTVPNIPPTSLTRRSTRKRRAPQPPVQVIQNNKENIKIVEVKNTETQMNPHLDNNKQKLQNNDASSGCKSEKYSKNENSKDMKAKSDKSFLKQIFDSRKRNSGIDISSVKLLPSISELDKQAAEIIKTCKLNASEQNNNVKNLVLQKIEVQSSSQTECWICVSCLRKYNSSVFTCLYCVSKQKVCAHDGKNNELASISNRCTQTEKKILQTTSNNDAAEDKQKLKEMLKEMKDSLPKKPKHDLHKTATNKDSANEAGGSRPFSMETPTLPVGSTSQSEKKTSTGVQHPLGNLISKSTMSPPLTITPASGKLVNKLDIANPGNKQTNDIQKRAGQVNLATNLQRTEFLTSEQYNTKKDLHTPLKISALLNPVYIPKPQATNIIRSQAEKQKIDNNITVTRTTADNLFNSPKEKNQIPVNKVPIKPITETKKIESQMPKNVNVGRGNYEKMDQTKINQRMGLPPSTSSNDQNVIKDKQTQDQHSRRRDLIHQLEQSIAKGDEVAAADAAAKLAQLRLSCSVLSYSSQILLEPSTSSANTNIELDKVTSNEVPAKINVPNENVKTQAQDKVQLLSFKEKTPQKATVRNVTSGNELLNTNEMVKVTQKSFNDKPLQKQETSIDVTGGSKKEKPKNKDTMTSISVLVEDREATRGPVQLRIGRQALLRDLRQEAEASLGLATHLQRWIIGRALCVNDNTPIISLAGPDFSSPFYLCVVDSETKTGSKTQIKMIDRANDQINLNTIAGNVYTELVQLEQQALVSNPEIFECGICMEEYAPGYGVVLRECVHIFCKDCLIDVVRYCEEPDIFCPAMGCRGMLQEREIRALVSPQDYERWLARGLAAAESGTRNAFHCRTRDCKGWALCEPGVRRFPCPVCKHVNCVPCQAIHNGETCVEHRSKLQAATANNTKASETDDGTRTLLNSLIAKGEALECPECNAIITKKWGCDWVKCSACKTEICWVTRGRRWGPSGKGDTSGGCRCGIDGKRCHPACGYCH